MSELHEKRIAEHIEARAEATRQANAERQKNLKVDANCRELRRKLSDADRKVANLLDRCATLKLSAFERCKQIAETNGDTKTAADIAAMIEGSK